jgi:hypothetical protein
MIREVLLFLDEKGRLKELVSGELEQIALNKDFTKVNSTIRYLLEPLHQDFDGELQHPLEHLQGC